MNVYVQNILNSSEAKKIQLLCWYTQWYRGRHSSWGLVQSHQAAPSGGWYSDYHKADLLVSFILMLISVSPTVTKKVVWAFIARQSYIGTDYTLAVKRILNSTLWLKTKRQTNFRNRTVGENRQKNTPINMYRQKKPTILWHISTCGSYRLAYWLIKLMRHSLSSFLLRSCGFPCVTPLPELSLWLAPDPIRLQSAVEQSSHGNMRAHILVGLCCSPWRLCMWVPVTEPTAPSLCLPPAALIRHRCSQPE